MFWGQLALFRLLMLGGMVWKVPDRYNLRITLDTLTETSWKQ